MFHDRGTVANQPSSCHNDARDVFSTDRAVSGGNDDGANKVRQSHTDPACFRDRGAARRQTSLALALSVRCCFRHVRLFDRSSGRRRSQRRTTIGRSTAGIASGCGADRLAPSGRRFQRERGRRSKAGSTRRRSGNARTTGFADGEHRRSLGHDWPGRHAALSAPPVTSPTSSWPLTSDLSRFIINKPGRKSVRACRFRQIAR